MTLDQFEAIMRDVILKVLDDTDEALWIIAEIDSRKREVELGEKLDDN